MKIRVLSFNLRVEAQVDGINRFSNRHGRVLEAIKDISPDLVGFQEANSDMKAWLSDTVSPLGYTLLGCGRNGDYTGEAASLAFRRGRFELISYETKWLSHTPDVPGSTFGGDQSACPRVLSAAVLKPAEGGVFLCLNTHLDHKGANARLLGAKQCMDYVTAKGLPFIITGDMNAGNDSPAIAEFTSRRPNGRETVDATKYLGGTFHAFGKKEKPEKLDYIFTDMPCDVNESRIIKYPPVDGVYVSDHDLIEAYVETVF